MKKDWENLAPIMMGSEESVEKILNNHKNVFPGILDQLHKEREIKIQVVHFSLAGNVKSIFLPMQQGRPGIMTVDLCFVLDCTGSMGPWIDTVKQQIRGITSGIVPAITKQYPGMTIELRFGMVFPPPFSPLVLIYKL
jgi:hypothetical protein